MRTTVPLLFFLVLLFLVGCEEVIQDATPSAHRELGILPKLIALPKPPVSVKWVVHEQPYKDGPVVSAQLTALLRFAPEDYHYIVQNSHDHGAISEASMVDGFLGRFASASDRPAIAPAEPNGYESGGFPAKEPNLFIVGFKSPYAKGKIYPLGGGYIIVSMSTF